jgi:hypothetical protein
MYKLATDKLATDKLATDKLATDKLATDKLATDKLATKRIKYFTIFGERCTGTHFLQHAILLNFDIAYLKGEKHFFGHRELRNLSSVPDDRLTSREKELKVFDNTNKDEMIAFAIIRDPVEWIDSFCKRPHHVPPENRKTAERFITSEFYSIYEEGFSKNQEILDDRNWLTKERYRDIFELRKWKCKYMLNTLPNQYKHFYFIRYEDLRDNYAETLDKIRVFFERDGLLCKKTSKNYEPVVKYKGTYNALYQKQQVIISNSIKHHIWKHVDTTQETEMGYFPK